jgi:thymidine kinase
MVLLPQNQPPKNQRKTMTIFEEPSASVNKIGSIEVVCGSMFSGKTEELIRRLKRAKIANLKIAIFKPSLDIRYHENMIVSHNENILDAKPVADPIEILNQVDEADVVGIDEAQFFNEKITSVCESLAGMGKRVILAGLDMDYLGKPFGPMPDLLATANYVTKLHAVCVKCGGTASYSFRISDENDQVVLGEKQHYEARCRSCHKL